MSHHGERAIPARGPPSRRVPSWTWLPDRGTVALQLLGDLSSQMPISPPVLNSSIFQGASFSCNEVGPPHEDADPTVHDLQLPVRFRHGLQKLLSGAPRAARLPSSDRPAIGRAAYLDHVRCRGAAARETEEVASQPRAPSAKQSATIRQVQVFGREKHWRDRSTVAPKTFPTPGTPLASPSWRRGDHIFPATTCL